MRCCWWMLLPGSGVVQWWTCTLVLFCTTMVRLELSPFSCWLAFTSSWCYTHLHEIWGFIWLACPVWWWCYTHLHDLRLYLVGMSCLVVMLHPPPWFEALFGWHDLFGGDVTPTSMIWGFIWLACPFGGDVTPTSMIWGFIWLVVMLHPPPWFEALFGWRVLFGGDVTPTSMIWGFIWLVVKLHPLPWFEALFGWRVLFGGDVTPTSMIWGFIWLACPVWWWCYTHLHDLRLYLVGGDVTPTSMIWGFIWLVVMLHPPPWFEALFGCHV